MGILGSDHFLGCIHNFPTRGWGGGWLIADCRSCGWLEAKNQLMNLFNEHAEDEDHSTSAETVRRFLF